MNRGREDCICWWIHLNFRLTAFILLPDWAAAESRRLPRGGIFPPQPWWNHCSGSCSKSAAPRPQQTWAAVTSTGVWLRQIYIRQLKQLVLGNHLVINRRIRQSYFCTRSFDEEGTKDQRVCRAFKDLKPFSLPGIWVFRRLVFANGMNFLNQKIPEIVELRQTTGLSTQPRRWQTICYLDTTQHTTK